MAIDVSFGLHLRGGKSIGEQEIANDLDTYRRLLQHDNYGAITIRAPGQPDVVIDDEVPSTVQNLSFRAVPNLLAGRPVAIPYFRYAGTVRVEPDGERVRITGDMVPEALYWRNEFTRAVYECGERFLGYLRRIAVDDPDAAAELRQLEPHASAARQALESGRS